MIDLNGIKVKNRFFIGSGPVKYGQGYRPWENPLSFIVRQTHLLKLDIFGGVVTKTLTLYPRKGNYLWWKPWKVLRPTRGGWYNRFGWNNCGIDYFVSKIYPKIKLNNLIPSIGVFDLNDIDGLLCMLEILNGLDILAVELNTSCPNVDIRLSDDFDTFGDFLTQAVNFSSHPLIVKLGAGDAVTKARIAEFCGINALTLINTIPQSVPRFGNCGLSGPKIKSTALKTIKDVKAAVNIPIIGGGGIYTADDCREFFDAGAEAVFFASVFLLHPLRPQKIARSFQR
jgi:dihydroorotate dehydrogenase (NAD+) catalytic subunit